MSRIYVKAAAILDVAAEDAYATIADYREWHPRIVPPQYFRDLQVEQGGYGEGTIIRFKVKMPGTELAFHQRVREPQPGRVLVEEDIDSVQNCQTTFTVEPVNAGRQARVEIATRMDASPGLRGHVERIFVPIVNARIYRQELKRLEAVAQQKRAQAAV